MNYTELIIEKGNACRLEYLNGIEKLVNEKLESAKKESTNKAKRFCNNSAMREEFIKLLGWPLTEYEFSVCNVRKSFLTEKNGITLYRIQIEVFAELWYYGILFVREDGKKRPLVISQHGGQGTPELCSSLEELGSGNYNEMTQRILKFDVNVFAPQMLLWEKERYFPDDDKGDVKRQLWDSRLKQCGGSITALEIYCLRKAIDYLSVQPFTLVEKIGMVGLSYGGFYTLYATAVDTRIKAALSSSFFNDRGVNCWADWTFFHNTNLNNFFFDPEVAMLIYPRYLNIAVGDVDPLFSSETARSEEKRLRQLSKKAYDNICWYDFTVFSGDHEFIKEDDALITFFEKLNQNEFLP